MQECCLPHIQAFVICNVQVTLKVDMMCGGCEAAVKRVLSKMDGAVPTYKGGLWRRIACQSCRAPLTFVRAMCTDALRRRTVCQMAAQFAARLYRYKRMCLQPAINRYMSRHSG